MGFFDREERAEDAEVLGDDEFEVPTSPWVGGVVPLELVLGRSDQAAVLLTSIVVYRESFDFTIRSFLHHAVKAKRRHRGLGGWHDLDDEEDPPDGYLRIGIAWPDGGRATNIDGWRRGWPGPDATEPLHGLEENGGGGSDREYSSDYHAWPVPETGQLQSIVEWPEYGISETATAVEAQLFREAAARSHPVWDGDADRPPRLSRFSMLRAIENRRGSERTTQADDE